MNRLQTSARLLALLVLDTPWNKAALTELLRGALSGGPPDPSALAARLLFHGGTERCPSFPRLVDLLSGDTDFRQRFSRPETDHSAIQLKPQATSMQSTITGLLTLPVPPIPTVHELATWLGLADRELNWFSAIDRRRDPKPVPSRHHYHYEWQPRTHTHERLLEKPKPRLKALQRRILTEILDRVPVHPCAHGFCRGRSCRSSVMPHLRKPVLLRLDLKDCFASVNRTRIQAVFRSVGYPSGVSRVLAGLCTHQSSAHLAGRRFRKLPWETRELLTTPHLPQGAPTSPALANLCAWHLDARLQGLARRLGLHYTRYADDLAFSGTINRRYVFSVVQPLIGAIALEEGFRLNHRKTCVSTAAQRQSFCGITVNRCPNLARSDYDRLKATLFNCVVHGPASQNRKQRHAFRQYLQGRVSHASFLNPGRGKKLQALMERIRWD
jgi:hypothetical protein